MSARTNDAQRLIVFAGCDREFGDTPRGRGLAKLLYLKALRSWVKPGAYAWWRLCDDIESAQRALAAGSRRAKTPQAVECEASQSGGSDSERNAHTPSAQPSSPSTGNTPKDSND